MMLIIFTISCIVTCILVCIDIFIQSKILKIAIIALSLINIIIADNTFSRILWIFVFTLNIISYVMTKNDA